MRKDKKQRVHKTPQILEKKGGTTKARQASFIASFLSTRFNISEACRICGINRKTFYLWKRNARFLQAFEDAAQEKIDQVEAALVRNIQAGDTTAIIFFLKTVGKTRGYIEGEKTKVGEAPAKHAVEILNSLLAGDIDAVKAALMFEKEGLPLPDSVRILLNKVEPVPPPSELPLSMSDEELEAGYQRKKAEIDEQKSKWLPERRAEVATIKEELKEADSWSAGAAENQKERG